MGTVTSEQIRSLIVELSLPPMVLDLFDGKCEIEELQDDFKDPYAILSLSAQEQEHYLVGRYKPILSFAFNVIIAYDVVSQRYVEYDIELFEEEELEPMSWDGILIDRLIYWDESQYYSDDEMIKWGELLGMKHIAEILRKIRQWEEAPEIEWDEWLKALKQEINSMN